MTLLYPFHALITSFSRTFIIEDNGNNGRNLAFCPFLDIAFIKEEDTGSIDGKAIGAINEATIGAIKPSCFFISCFTISVAPSINRADFSSDSRKSSFEKNKVNPFLLILQRLSQIFLFQIYLR